MRLRLIRFYLLIVALAFSSLASGVRDGPAIWDSRCEQCHGDPVDFANKYLWNQDGQLQGQHHVDDMHLFMQNHYIPAHEIDIVHDMLLDEANSPRRFEEECSECHGEVGEFVEASFWVGKKSISSNSGNDVGEFMLTHRELTEAEVTFYLKLFYRAVGKPIPSELMRTGGPGLEFR